MRRGAWNLLLLALSRSLLRYLKTEELDALFTWIAEAVDRTANPLSFVKRAVGHARASRKAAQQREEDHAQTTQDSGSLSVAFEGEGRVWASEATPSDPLLKRKLHAALQLLTPRQREAFLLAEVEEMSGPDIGAVMGLAPKTIRNLLTDARKILRDTLGDVSANE